VETLRAAHIGLHDSHGRNVPIETILVESKKQAFAQLEAFAKRKTSPGCRIHALCGEFVNQIPSINRLVRCNCFNPFRFIFLDPKGWADIPMDELKPFLSDRSCEVLINLMTRQIIRFVEEESHAESYQKLFGRPGVLEKLRTTAKEDRADQAVREYCRSLSRLCGFKYVSSAVILEPNEESIRYFLVYATNNFHGIEVFKQAEMATARTQDDVRHEARLRKTQQPEFIFELSSPKSRLIIELRERYLTRAKDKVRKVLKEKTDPSGAAYETLFCEAMAFPLVTPDDLQNWIHDWIPYVRLRLAGAPNRKKPSPAVDDRVVLIDPVGLN
jgi:three-Cys-motif partner protein